jgi:hypothetical protein
MSTNFKTADDAKRFIKGGRATLTVRSHKTGAHKTFRVSRKTEDSPFFVGLLTGPDNTSNYTYMGVLTGDGEVRLTRASKLHNDSLPVLAWNYVGRKIWSGKLPADADVMHEGKCGCCGRALTHPESIERGIGPECWSRLAGG